MIYFSRMVDPMSSLTSAMLQAGFELAQKLSLDFVG